MIVKKYGYVFGFQYTVRSVFMVLCAIICGVVGTLAVPNTVWAGVVTLHPGDDIQSMVTANGVGTTFQLSVGTYRMQSIVPKDGDIFLGTLDASGNRQTIISGARLLTSFTRSGNYWVANGQSQENWSRVGECVSGYPRCAYPEDLYINNQPLKAVSSLSAVTAGTFYFDYGADTIYFLDDPTGKTVEASVSSSAFSGGATGVVIKNVVIEKYASPAQFAALGGNNIGSGWDIENNEIRWIHGMGAKMSVNGKYINNVIHDIGQLGLGGGTGGGGLVDGNEFYNMKMWAGYAIGWEGGATKFWATNGLILQNNYLHDNQGCALWADTDNVNMIYQGNYLRNNECGILHEVSYDAIIRNNTFIDNDAVKINDSRNVEIYGNKVIITTAPGRVDAIQFMQQQRGVAVGTSDPCTLSAGTCTVVNNYVHDNDVTYKVSGDHGYNGGGADWNFNAMYVLGNNRFNNNKYHVLNTSQAYWNWAGGIGGGPLTFTQFKSYGFESTGTVDSNTDVVIPPPPSHAVVATPSSVPASIPGELGHGILPTSSYVGLGGTVSPLAITDGDTNTNNWVEAGNGSQWIQIDLGQAYALNDIKVWHYFGDSRSYHDVIVQVSSDPTFASGVTTVYNNDSNNSLGLGAGTQTEYMETSAGKDITFSTTTARYVRLWSNGNTSNTFNHYVEVQIFGSVPDTTAPVVSITSPTNTATVSGTITISSNASDNVGVAGVQFKVDGNTIGAEDTTSPYQATLDTTTLTKGVHAIVATARDSAGNSVSASLTITVNNVVVTPPPVAGELSRGIVPTFSFGGVGGPVARGSVTDGDTNTDNWIEVGSGPQWIQIDLGQTYALNDIKLWHYSGDGRTYHDVVVQVSSDPTFSTGVATVYNNDSNNSLGFGTGSQAEYAETSSGKDIPFSATNARYVRVWSNGNSVNSFNHYVEVQVFGLPAVVVVPPIVPPIVPPVVDITPPVVTITTPVNNATVSGAITVTSNASDNVGIVGIQFKVDGNNISADTVGSSYQAIVDTTTLTNGAHTILVTARDLAGNSTSASVGIVVNNIVTAPPSTPVSNGPFTAKYYTLNAKKQIFDTLKLTRTDQLIDFDWGTGSPDQSLPTENFGARWIGSINFPSKGVYTFTAVTDDGMRIWIDDVKVLDKWFSQVATYTFTRNISRGNHTVKVEYYESTASAKAKVSWVLSQVLGANTIHLSQALFKGISSEEVTILQQYLYDHGYLHVQPTGYFGELTKQAVMELQKANNISPVGSVGPLTRELINR